MSQLLAELIDRPLKIGARIIPNRLILAPMTGLGHVAYRHWLDELGGCGLMYSEMCSAARIPHEDRSKSFYFRWRDEERNKLVIQILGADPQRMADAARRIEAEGLFGVDINLGCSVREVCRFQQGAALLKTPDAALQLVDRVRQAVACPVTVKFRTGWEDDPAMAVAFARRLEEVGVDALIFHPRVAPDRRTRPPKWEYIGLVKQAVGVPVIGNGDVFSAEDCLRMFQQTGCDGVALGRIAIARPWSFCRWATAGMSKDYPYLQGSLRYLELLNLHYDSTPALRRFKQYASYLASNFAFGNTLFNHLKYASDIQTIEAEMTRFFSMAPQLLDLPNMNFMR